MQALPHRDVAAAIERVRASNAPPGVKLAFEFLVLTAVRGAMWTEIDRDDSVWTLPATRTKANREHRVPLCRRAWEVLDAARRLGDGGPLVFPDVRGKPLGDMVLSGLLKDLKIAAVPHGFRSSFRDWAAEDTNHPREVAEAALAHVVRNQVEAAYAHSDLFERRRILMDDWERYLAQGMAKDSEPPRWPGVSAPGAGGRYPRLEPRFTTPGCDVNSLTTAGTKYRPRQWAYFSHEGELIRSGSIINIECV